MVAFSASIKRTVVNCMFDKYRKNRLPIPKICPRGHTISMTHARPRENLKVCISIQTVPLPLHAQLN